MSSLWLFSSAFAFLIFSVRAACPPLHPPCCVHPNSIWCRVQIVKLLFLSSSVNSSVLCPNILLTTLFPNVRNPCSLPRVRDQVPYPYKRTVVVVASLDKELGDKKVLNRKVSTSPRIYSARNFFVNVIFFIVVPNVKGIVK
jgi:hypothetical protein